MIISRTPLRVSFLGGGSDLPPYYRRHGGAVLSTTIDHAVYVTVSRKFDDAVRVSYSRTEEVPSAAEVAHPLVREALKHAGIEGGIEITSVADIPAKGTGLGSSSSFTVGLLNALHAYLGRHASAESLARESCVIEIDRCGEPIGKQDQYAAAFGGFNFIRFNADDTVDVQKVICATDLLSALQDRLLFFYTGQTRSASPLLKEQSDEVSRPGARTNATGQLVHLAEAAYDEICRGEIDNLGPFLHEAWHIKRTINSGVTNKIIDEAYDAAIAAGAQGGKVLGAGGGGFLMFLVPKAHQEAVRRVLGRLRETPFRFASQGSKIIFVH
ncbi:GHMP kinase [Microbaculum marinum]|uniref:GHMP kinase n=1 Tax=Microbaculum marinum TaxID=1764581 RepID=A0AAW9RR73_9HYPH